MHFDDEISRRYPHIRFKCHWQLDPETVRLLGKCEALVDTIALLPLQPAYRKQLLSVSLVKGAQATTAIEGNTLTEREVQRVADGESLPLSKQYQEREVRNVLDAMNELLARVAYGGDSSLISERLIKEFHVMIGRDLGEHFDAIPGRFREDERTVGPYKCPRHEDLSELIERLCQWLPEEFGFSTGRQSFSEAIIQAIVTHAYFEWIHPFGDGNGRTGRLLEFYILLRAGNPDIASHILSNFYNLTRPEYYRHLDRANRDQDLTAFIRYAVRGYHDGLQQSFESVKESIFEMAWKYLVHQRFAERPYRKKNVLKRHRDLALSMPPVRWLSPQDIPVLTADLARQYGALSPRTLVRDLSDLKGMGLVEEENGKYRINLGLLGSQVPSRRQRGAKAGG
jgi:Fic family protein